MTRARLIAFVLALAAAASLSAQPLAQQPGPGAKTPCQLRAEALQAYYAANPPAPTSYGFPAIPEIEYENSLITFRICIVKKGLTPEQEERRKKSWKCCDPEFYDVQLVRLDAYMRLCREAPVLNELGFRELRFTIERWELFGRAGIFDGDIVFSATPGVVQPKSLAFSTRSGIPEGCQDLAGGVSGSDECEQYKGPSAMESLSRLDYPAMIVYNAIYDVWLSSRKLVAAEPGIAMARGVNQIPPTAITVAFQKPLETTLPDGRIIKICPGTCSGMVTIPEHMFWSGIATAEGIKAGTVTLPDDWQPAATTRPAAKMRPAAKKSASTTSKRRP